MANTPISGFTSGAPAQSGDQFVIARSGANYKLTAANLATYMSSNMTLTVGTTPTSGGAAGQLVFDTGTVIQESSGLVWNDASKLLTATGLGSGGGATAGGLTVSGGSFGLSGNISANAWTTAGIRYRNAAATLTDLTSSGVVAAGYTDVFGGNTIAASNATTFTNYATLFVNGPTAGANVTFTNKYALGLGGNVLVNETAGGSALTLTGATQTTSNPVINATQTWNAAGVTFTGLKLNVTDTASAAGSLLLDLQVGGTSKASIDKSGNITAIASVGVNSSNGFAFAANSLKALINGGNPWFSNAGQLRFVSGFGLAWVSSTTDPVNSVADLFIIRAAAASLQLGAADAAAPVAQTLGVQSVVAGTSNTAGANFTIAGSKGTGTGAGGSIIFQVAPAGTTGTAQNAFATALTIDSTRTILLSTYGFARNIDANTVALFGGGDGVTNWPSVALRNQALSSVTLIANTGIGFTGNSPSTGAFDVALYRDAANTLALRNGTNAQTFNVYNTYTDAANYEKMRLYWTGNIATLSTLSAGTGTARSLGFEISGTLAWTMNTSGHFLAFTDNTYDIGASGANRPRNVYVADTIYSNNMRAGTGAAIYWAIGTQMRSSTDGVILFQNAAQTDFARIQLGGTTSSFPAIKRYGANISFRLADDSADAAITASNVVASGNVTAGDTKQLGWLTSRAAMTSPADGVVKITTNNGTGGGAIFYNAFTYATLPTASAGMVAYISDASNAAPAFGDTVSAGGGTTKVLAWYNGANWTVIGK